MILDSGQKDNSTLLFTTYKEPHDGWIHFDPGIELRLFFEPCRE